MLGGWLEELREEVRAVSATLIGFDDGSDAFRVVGSTGRALLADGALLPTTVCGAVSAALRGGDADSAGDARPLAALTAAAGVGTRLVVPLHHQTGVVGAVDLAWTGDSVDRESVADAVASRRADLLACLTPVPGEHVLICHEDLLVAGGLARQLERQLPVSIDVAHTVEEGIDCAERRPPDLILCSDRLSSGEALPEIARRLREAGTAAPVLAIVRTDSAQAFEGVLAAGAAGYVPLAAAADRISEVALALLSGQSVLTSPTADGAAPRLTKREYEVLVACERGLSHKQVAGELQVAVSTVKTHARSMYAKLEATSRTEALHKARQAGLLT
jgi:DNA-binding NarL/FixJ family response regulator